jgi:hypothetical protein
MSRMFCTVKEAAETLHASEDQINTLLERGILHEFRQGPHRLLRLADVGALGLIRERGPQVQPPAEPPSPRRSGRVTARKVQRSATARRSAPKSAVARPPRPPRNKRAGHKTANQVPGTEPGTMAGPRGRKAGTQERRHALPSGDLFHVCPSCAAAVARPPSALRPPSCTPPAQPLRQWFWMGLVQDRPFTLALLSGLVLLALSALVAGICLAAEGF